jgi:hypothetical protein
MRDLTPGEAVLLLLMAIGLIMVIVLWAGVLI